MRDQNDKILQESKNELGGKEKEILERLDQKEKNLADRQKIMDNRKHDLELERVRLEQEKSKAALER